MSNNNQLNILQRYKQEALKQQSRLTHFDNLVGIYLATEPEPYYPKKKGADGKALKDKDGKELREENPTGYKLTFAQYITCKKIVCVVREVPDFINSPEAILTAFRVQGLGYDIKGSMYFLEEAVKIELL